MFSAVLPLVPMGRPRQRVRVVTPKGGAPFATTYTPEKGDYANWRTKAVILLQSARRGAPPIPGPLGLQAVFFFPMPASEHRKREPRPRRWHTSKPDIDNVLKSCQDVMVEAGWLADDAVIAQVSAQKIVAEQGRPPSVHLTLSFLPEVP